MLAAAVLIGCRPSEASLANGDDALRALDVATPSTRYTHDFWVREARAATALWDSAYVRCSAVWQAGAADLHPNCGHVRTAGFATSAGKQDVRGRDMGVDANRLPP